LADSIEIKHAATATEFWSLLSPEKPLFAPPSKLLYRGQADDRWHLTPGILRKGMCSTADMQVFKEWAYIETFVRHCDSIGLAIPNDSPAFRQKFLNKNNPTGPGGPVSEWPSTEMLPLMALAQHYRLPTRLLDWSTRAYVAAYFAISEALAGKAGADAVRLAVWVLDIEKQALFHELKVVAVPGGNNANLAAQSGRFTLLTQQGGRARPFEGETAVDLYFAAQSLPPPLKKITLPISEAAGALKLCALYGVTGAMLFPDYYGAARATDDALSTQPPEGTLSLWDV
jgi:FRG domain